MKKITLLLLLVSSIVFAQSNVTNVLNQDCGATLCTEFTLGCCNTDGSSHPDQDPTLCNYKVYYVTENVILNYETLNLRNCTLEFRNGTNLIDNGLTVNLSTSEGCEANIIFIGGGQRFASVEQMNATLGIRTYDLNKTLPNQVSYKIYAITGQLIGFGTTNNTKVSDLNFKGQIAFLLLDGYEVKKLIK